MTTKMKLLACGMALTLTAGCTTEELQSFAIGAGVAALAISASQSSADNAYGPTSCAYDEKLEVGYDEYNNPVRFCVYNPDY